MLCAVPTYHQTVKKYSRDDDNSTKIKPYKVAMAEHTTSAAPAVEFQNSGILSLLDRMGWYWPVCRRGSLRNSKLLVCVLLVQQAIRRLISEMPRAGCPKRQMKSEAKEQEKAGTASPENVGN